MGQRKLFKGHSPVDRASNRSEKVLNASAIDCGMQKERNRAMRTLFRKAFPASQNHLALFVDKSTYPVFDRVAG